MSIKVMQNYQYLMQIPTGKDQNVRNIGLNNPYYQNCLCKHLEDNSVPYTRIENKSHLGKKSEDLALSNKSVETSDSFKRHNIVSAANEKGFDTLGFYNKMDLNVSHLNAKSKIDNKMNEVSDSVGSASYMQAILESNLCNRNPSGSFKSDLNNKYFNHGDSTSNYTKAERFKFEKDVKSPNFYTERNLSFLMCKNQNVDVCIRQNPAQTFVSERVENSDLISKNIENFDTNEEIHNDSDPTKRPETSDMQAKKCENNDMVTKAVNDPNLENNNIETSASYTKHNSDVYSKDQISASYCNKDIQTVLAKKHFLTNMLSAKINLCGVCRKNFSTRGNLQNHHIVHSGQKPHECSVCKKTFSQRSTLGKHYLIHTGEKPHLCKVCGRGFRQANNLRIHFLTHSGEKPHPCNICDRRFTQKIALQKHMLTHSGVKPHECDVCKRCFTTKGNLQKHFLTHTGEKPHICSTCNRGFSQKIALKKHHLTHTGEKPHICNVCGKGFTTKGNLKSHFKRHTKEKISTTSLSASSLVRSSPVSHPLLVPRSIAQSILSPNTKEDRIPNYVSNSIPTSVTDTKYIPPAISYTKNSPIVTSPQTLLPLDKATLSKPFALPKSLGASHYTMSNHQFSTVPSLSHTLMSSQPQNLTSTSHQVPMFYPTTLSNISSNTSVFSSPSHKTNAPITSPATQAQINQTSTHIQKHILSSSQALSVSTSSVNLKPSGKDVNIYALCSSPINAVAPASYSIAQTYQSPSVNAISQVQRQMYNSANMHHSFTTSTSQVPENITRTDTDPAMDSSPLTQQTSSRISSSTSYSTVQNLPSSKMNNTYQSQSINAVSQVHKEMISHSCTSQPHSSPDDDKTGNLSDACSQALGLENPPVEPITLSSCSTIQPYMSQTCDLQPVNMKSQVQKQMYSSSASSQACSGTNSSISYDTNVSRSYTGSPHISLQTPPISSITPPLSYSKHSVDILPNLQNNNTNTVSSNPSMHTEQMHVESGGTKTPF